MAAFPFFFKNTLVFMVCLALIGCAGEDGETGPAGPAGPTANIDALESKVDQLQSTIDSLLTIPAAQFQLNTDLRTELDGCWSVENVCADNVRWRFVSAQENSGELDVTVSVSIQYTNNRRTGVLIEHRFEFTDRDRLRITNHSPFNTYPVAAGETRRYTDVFQIRLDNVNVTNSIVSMTIFALFFDQ